MWLIAFFFLQDCVMYRMQVISLFHHAEFSRFYNSHYLFTLLFLSKQTRRGTLRISFYFFLFICGHAVYRASNVWGHECKSSCLVLQLQCAEVSLKGDQEL